MESIELSRILHSGSFFNLWYWIFVAVMWSRITYWSVGVPLHDVRYAARNPDQGMAELETIMDINMRRQNEMFDSYGVYVVGIYFFILATLVTLAGIYNFEVVYAVALLWGFGGFATFMSVRFSYRLAKKPLRGHELIKAYFRHQRAKQFFGVFAIFCTSLFGMLHRLYL